MPEAYIPEPPHDKDGTQPNKPIQAPKYPVPPPANLPEVEVNKPKRGELRGAEKPTSITPYATVELAMPPRKPKPQVPRGGFYIPAWSILLTLIFVFACAFSMLALVITLGGDAAPGGQPVIQVITPMQTPTSPLDALLTTPTPTLQTVSTGGNQFFDLIGPTLPAVQFTPTPVLIAVGVNVSVDVDGGLNVRPEPGVNNTERFRANFGEIFTVVDGPQNANGFTWWFIQDVNNAARSGWAAGEFLKVVQQ